ncbi:Hint domain-containing protein [Acetobacter malorum]|uniref:Hint domain-containing protein n=1 Tax=Acetobacter malorum TaxID=178901 RepID=UPI0038CF626A
MNSGTQYVAISGAAISSVISAGGEQIVSSGGSAISDKVLAGGLETVLSGGTTSSSTVASGGTMIVSSGASATVAGIAVNTNVESGGSAIFYYNAAEIVSGGTDHNVTLSGGYLDIRSGGTAIQYNAQNDSYVGITGGGTSLSGVINNSHEWVGESHYDTANASATTGPGISINDTIINSSTQIIAAAGKASGSVLSAGGHQSISAGGSSVAAKVMSGGIEEILSGGVASASQISSGGTAILHTSTGLVGATLLDHGSIDFAYLGGTIKNVTVTSSGLLTASSTNGSSTSIQLAGTYPSTEDSFVYSGDTLTLVCFLTGTMIRTPEGEVAVEELQIGDDVITFDWQQGREVVRPLTWVGRQKSCVRSELPDDQAGYPVRVRKGAIAEGVPHKDLLVTPEHCLFFEGKFVPVRMLVNQRSIFYDRTLTSYEFFHIETDEHSVIWSDGMLSESYLDTGNRKNFSQHGQIATLHQPSRTWASDAGASLTTDRETVEPLFHRLEARSETMGLQICAEPASQTQDADLHVVTDKGAIIRKAREKNGQAVFMLPSGTKEVQLVSRTSRPCDTIGPFVDDRRDLGVLVGEVTVFDGLTARKINDHLVTPDLDGWDVIETGACRWTNGNARITLGDLQKNSLGLLTVEILAGGPYQQDTVSAEKHANVG